MSNSRPDRFTVPVAALALLGLVGALFASSAATIGGGFAFPLDDSYIHAALARTVAESGTWGIRDGLFASASSSPAYTALLAGLFALFQPAIWLLLAVNGAAGVAVLSLSARLARERSATTVGAVLLLAPLPYLVGLGMEHVLHAALILGIVILAESAPTGRRRLALLALCAVAPLVRYESLFAIAAIAAMFWSERERWLATSVLIAGGSLLACFAAWSLAHGGFPVPNSLLMKSGLVAGYADQLRRNIGEGAPVIGLAVAALALAPTPRDQRRAVMFASCVVLQVGVAGIGWLFRYEGWLVIWGLVLVVPLLSSTAGSAAWRACIVLATLGPCSWRAWQAWSCFAPATLAVHAGDGALARMVSVRFPTSPVAVHDIGILAWTTSVPILDLAGLASTEVTRLHVQHQLDGESLDSLVRTGGVEIAWADSHWLPNDLPGTFDEVGTVSYPIGGGGFATTHVWVTKPELLAPVERALIGMSAVEPLTRVAIHRAIRLGLGDVTLEGAAVKREAAEIAFYSDGSAHFFAPADGVLSLVTRGTAAGGRGPILQVRVGGRSEQIAVTAEARQTSGPDVNAGELVELVFVDDAVDDDGNDRNIWVGDLQVVHGRR